MAGRFKEEYNCKMSKENQIIMKKFKFFSHFHLYLDCFLSSKSQLFSDITES